MSILNNSDFLNNGFEPNNLILVSELPLLFYGTTNQGGIFNGGVLFSYDGVSITVLINFGRTSTTDGSNPVLGLLINEMIIYGINSTGGQFGSGTLWSYNPTIIVRFTPLISLQTGFQIIPNVPSSIYGNYTTFNIHPPPTISPSIFISSTTGIYYVPIQSPSLIPFYSTTDLNNFIIDKNNYLIFTSLINGLYQLTITQPGSTSAKLSIYQNVPSVFTPISNTLIVYGLSNNIYYGASSTGGIGFGYIFSINLGVLSILYNFSNSSENLINNMEISPDGLYLYYVTQPSGSNYGQILSLPTSTPITPIVIYSFTTSISGHNPNLIFTDFVNNSPPVLYGTTLLGGNGYGTIFSLQFQPSCFNQGTKILCLIQSEGSEIEQYISIENLSEGMHVKTYLHGKMEIGYISSGSFINDPNKFTSCMYICKKKNDISLIDDLIITGGHSNLVDRIDQFNTNHKNTSKYLTGSKAKIDDKYLLLTVDNPNFTQCKDKNIYTYYHFSLKGYNNDQQYGIWANGLLSETCSENYLRSHT